MSLSPAIAPPAVRSVVAGAASGRDPVPDTLPTVLAWLEEDAERAARIRRRLASSLAEHGLALGYADPRSHTRVPEWELGLVPLILGAAEWQLLQRAVIQQARMLDAFLRDVYGPQTVLGDRVVPPDLVLGDPLFRRPCTRLAPLTHAPAPLLRFDLVRSGGSWRFLHAWSDAPAGLFLAAQNRRLMALEAAEILDLLPPFHSLSDFPLRLAEVLRAAAPGRPSEPSVVVLSEGSADPYHGEHGFLARRMGLPLVEGGDLLVLDHRLHHKTVHGLRPVDVVYRRMPDSRIDPVVLPTEQPGAGIPGLFPCLIRGTVAVINAVGSGCAESRALPAYAATLCRHFLGERPVLPWIEVAYAGDPDQLESLLDPDESYRLTTIHAPERFRPPARARFLDAGPEGWPGLVRRHPHLFAGERLPAPDPHPVWRDGRLEHRPLRLSLFAIHHGDRLEVVPGGLAVLGDLADPYGSFPFAVGPSVDVVVTDGRDPAPEPPVTLAARSRAPLGSRVAESLFWIGRYAERAENVARVASLLDGVGLEDIAADERGDWAAFWQAALATAGRAPGAAPPAAGPASGAFLTSILLDPTHPASARVSVEWLHANVRRLRDTFSPESWRVVHHLESRLHALARAPEAGPSEAREAGRLVLDLVPAFLGTVDRTMPHDTGWRFLRLGLHLERAITTCAALRHALDLPAPGVRAGLTALIRLLGSLDAFRRAYHAHPQAATVAEFFLSDRDSPQSLAHCLRSAAQHLAAVAEDGGPPGPAAAAAALLRSLAPLAGAARPDAPLPLPGLEGTAEPLPAALERLLHDLEGLSETIADACFSHQASLRPLA